MPQASDLTQFDAVEIVRLPNSSSEIDAYYSHFPDQKIRIGDIGVVLGDWPNNKLRVEAVDDNNAIVWQDHFDRDHLRLVAPTDAKYSRRRINDHWAWQNYMSGETTTKQYRSALSFARKVMAFAKRNVDTLIGRLSESGYEFVSQPLVVPESDLENKISELNERGIFLPISLQAWLMEIGCVDFCGTHPAWSPTGYAGLNDDDEQYEPWYTDPLCIGVSVDSMLSEIDGVAIETIDLAPDAITKANVSGAGPISMHCSSQRFDDVLIGQHGCFTLLSYLRHAFEWGGFPGFAYIPDAPTEMLQSWSQGLTEL